ncbi:bacillithiol system redox-active protein YtxJ [Halobacillus salinus]|uniref:Bacillithiol system redox-active protein YtxJ n=1 Tax=Halobacillus salinus TaxID=192814 RepID=A0A4Z0H3L4_9BACI|nr:bacillithiol system redox-active protein YtxJ [Halobacillus salinus]TGB04031.1 bacillithiol system redox-active protein YtxJ [Halobacillus salinus]
MSVPVITSKEEFERTLDENKTFFLLKNSLTCPISAMARNRYNSFSKESEVPCYMLHVQEARELSNQIAEDFSIQHESPQALLFSNRKVVWNDSHGSITKRNLQKALP